MLMAAKITNFSNLRTPLKTHVHTRLAIETVVPLPKSRQEQRQATPKRTRARAPSWPRGAMLLGIVKNLLRAATSPPSRSDAAGHSGLVSLVYAGAVLMEIILCGIIIARVACETTSAVVNLPVIKVHYELCASQDRSVLGRALRVVVCSTADMPDRL